MVDDVLPGLGPNKLACKSLDYKSCWRATGSLDQRGSRFFKAEQGRGPGAARCSPVQPGAASRVSRVRPAGRLYRTGCKLKGRTELHLNQSHA